MLNKRNEKLLQKLEEEIKNGNPPGVLLYSSLLCEAIGISNEPLSKIFIFDEETDTTYLSFFKR